MSKKTAGFRDRLKGAWGTLQQLFGANGQASARGSRRLAPLQELEDRRLLSAAPIGPEFKINTTTSDIQQTTANTPRSIAVAPSGDAIAVWASRNQDGNGWGVFAQRYNAAGAAQGAEFRVNATITNDQLNPSVAVDSSGNFAITWSSKQSGNWDIYARRYAANGTALGSEFRVNTNTANDQETSSIAMDPTGRFVITWESNGQDGGGRGVFAQRYSSAGVAQGSEFLVNTFTSGDQTEPQVGMDASGNFVIAWTSGGGQDGDNNGVFAQRFNAAGVLQGSEFRVNTYTLKEQENPDVAIDPNGNFVITWSSKDQDGDNYGVYAQRYDSAGNPRGGEFQVNTFTTKEQRYSSAAIDATGNFVVTWSSKAQEGAGDNWGIYARRYFASGSADGGEFQVNTATNNDQQYSSVGMSPAGNFFVLWSGEGTGDSAGVFAQRYAASNPGINVTGSTFLVSVDNSVLRINSLTGAVVVTYSTGVANDGSTFGPDGSLYVADYYNDSILHYDATGTLLSSFATTGTPQGLAFGPDGNLYVATTNSTVEKYSPAGTSLGTFISAGSGGLSNAKAIVWGPDGNAYVSSYSNSRIIRYDGTTGAFINVFATGSGGFEDFTFGPDNNLYVASYGNNAVYRYDGTTGAALGTFVSGLATPYGLRFDPAGNLDVSSRSLGQIRTYDGATGAYLGTLVSGLTNPAYMSTTISLVTTSAGGTANFSVMLNTQPVADVVMTLSSTMPGQGTLSQSSLTFTTANWNVAQTVTVTGLNDGIPNGDQIYQINGTASSADANYNGASMAPIVVTNREVAVPNTAPVLDPSASPVLAAQTQNAGVPVGAVGTLVSALVDFTGGGGLDNVTDPDGGAMLGIAVIGADATNGTWWYSTDNGSTWNSLGTVSDANALLLPADGNARLYFQPNANWVGAIPNAVTFRVWDRTSGAAGGTANLINSSTVLDRFSSGAYGNNNGTTNWTAAWVENDSNGGGASGGRIQINSGQLDVRANTIGDWISREVNLSGATSATLSLNYINNLGSGDSIVIQMSNNGGASYSALAGGTFSPSLNPGSGTLSYDISGFISANTRVRFFVAGNSTKNHLYLDNVGISFSTTTAGSTSAFSSATDSASITVAPVAGINVSAISGPTTEAGGTATFTVVLNSQPTANVTVGISSSDTAEGTVSVSSLTFTSVNWNVAQTVTVTGVDDAVVDGDVNYTIVTAPATSTDAAYNNLNANDVVVTNLDNETAGIFVSSISGPTTEAGGTATFSVVLNSQPVANVIVGISSSNTAEGTVSTSSLTFTSANWNVAQTVTVTGVDDAVVDGDVNYTIVTAPASGGDPNYNNLNPADVAVVNSDNDATGIIVTPTSGLVTSETGTSATFTVRLNSAPLLPVTIGLSSSSPAEGVVSTPSLTFTLLNWNIPQTVTITGGDDFVADGNAGYTIVTAPATSLDLFYNGVNAADVSVTNVDNDVAGVTVSAISSPTTEAGGTASFSVVLDSQPTADVTIGLNSSNLVEGTLSTSSLTFTPANWNVAQNVTVIGVDDFVADGNVNYLIVTATPVSADSAYNGLDPNDVVATNLDNDVVGINVGAISGPTTEAGGTATFSVTLNSQPTADVTVSFSSSNAAEGTVSTASLTFTGANWNVAQVVTVTGVDDFVADGNVAYTILMAPAASADANYNGLAAAGSNVINMDDDVAGIYVTPTSLTTSETGASASFSMALTSQPTTPVTINLAMSNAGQGSLSQSSLTFDANNWSVAQTVTVIGLDDHIVHGDQSYQITGSATSGDGNYNAQSMTPVSVTNTEADVAGIAVTPTTGLITTPGGSANFSIYLTSQPTSRVTILLSSSNPLAGTVSQTSVDFTAADWNLPKTITVTSLNHSGYTGDTTFTIQVGQALSTDLMYHGRLGSAVTLTLHAASVGLPTLVGPIVLTYGTPPPPSPPAPAIDVSSADSVNSASLEARIIWQPRIIAPDAGRVNGSLESGTPAFMVQAPVVANHTTHVFAAPPRSMSQPMPESAATPEDVPLHMPVFRMTQPITTAQVQATPFDEVLDILNDAGERMPWTEPGVEMTALVGTSILAGSGYVLLNSRLGLWLLGLLTARPLWKQFDPLEVLYAWEDDGRIRSTDVEDEETLISLVD